MTIGRVIGFALVVICCMAFGAVLLRPAPIRSLQLDLDAPDVFVSSYFPTAATSKKAYYSIEDSLLLVAKGERGEWQMGCELVTLDPGSDDVRWLHCFGDPMDEAETLRLAIAICQSLGLPSTVLSNWYHERGAAVLGSSSCLQTGEYRGRHCSVEIRDGLTESPTLRVNITIEIR